MEYLTTKSITQNLKSKQNIIKDLAFLSDLIGNPDDASYWSNVKRAIKGRHPIGVLIHMDPYT